MSSKIKVDTIENVAGSGNVSLGSGHNLVVPGNITGQGTAAITSNATVGGTLGVTGTSALTGNVGIGAAAGGNPLVVQSDSGAGGIDLLGRSSDNTSTMLSGKSADGNTTYNTITSYANRMRIQSGATSSDTNTMEFFVNDVSRMVIDASGRVTKPNLPSFLTYGSPSMTATSGGAGYFHNFQNTGQSFNNGSHYNNTTGRFTAPVAGKYMFGLSITRDQAYSGSNQLIYVSKNSDTTAGAYVGSNASASQQYDQIQCHFIYNLAANDFVVGTYYIGAGTFTRTATSPRNSFYGFLIG